MNHNTTLAAAAIVAAMAVTGIAATANPVFAWGHHHHDNGIKVNQSIDQLNVCSGSPLIRPGLAASTSNASTAAAAVVPSPSTTCINLGSNSADIH